MLPREKARVLRLIITLMGRSVGQESILPATVTNHYRSLVTMGAGAVMGLGGCPTFTRLRGVWHHLLWLRTYGEERWAQWQKAPEAKHHARKRTMQDQQSNPDNGTEPRRGQAGNAAMDFYAKPVPADGGRQGLHFVVMSADDMHRPDAS